MTTFKETLAALKRRVGDNTDPISPEEALDKVAQKIADETGISKEAVLGKMLMSGAGTAAKHIEKIPGALWRNKWRALEAGFIGHQGLQDARRYAARKTPKFPRPARGLGVND